MPYVPGFDNDLFISYASLDNDEGAVKEFVETLEKHLSDNLVNVVSPKEKVKIYFDRDRLGTATAVNWEQDLEVAAGSCALLVPLLSPKTAPDTAQDELRSCRCVAEGADERLGGAGQCVG